MSPSDVSILAEDAYRIDAEIDGEVVGLDILDTAGQVSFGSLLPKIVDIVDVGALNVHVCCESFSRASMFVW